MARCSRCNAFILIASRSGYCKKCENALLEEEKKRQEEEARRKAEEERIRRDEERRKAEEIRRKQEEKEIEKAKSSLEMFRLVLYAVGRSIAAGNNKVIRQRFGNGKIEFGFGDIPIGDKLPPASFLEMWHIYSWVTFFREDGSEIVMVYCRPSAESETFAALGAYILGGIKGSINPIVISNEDADVIFSKGACWKYEEQNRLPIGFSYERLHRSIRYVDGKEKWDPSLFSQDYIIKFNCKSLPQEMYKYLTEPFVCFL